MPFYRKSPVDASTFTLLFLIVGGGGGGGDGVKLQILGKTFSSSFKYKRMT